MRLPSSHGGLNVLLYAGVLYVIFFVIIWRDLYVKDAYRDIFESPYQHNKSFEWALVEKGNKGM